jgi:hypothetical protein
MAKVVRHLREGQAEFQKVFAKLCNTKSAWQAWSDFVEMTAISISNSCEIRSKVKQEREERYMSIIGQYSKGEQALFPELLGILVASLERDSEQDFLGEMFMALELGSHWHGQFFTPYNVCKMMAKVNTADAKDRLATKGWIGVHDPACGAGATLIGARNALELDGIGGTQAFFVGQDIDRTAAMMCYIQLSLLGCAGYVVIADTLIHPVTGPMLWPNLTEYQDAWFMPLNFLEPTWVMRLSQTWRGIDVENETNCRKKLADSQKDAKKAQKKVAAKPPETVAEKQQMSPLPIKDADDGQLTLF